MLKKSLAWLAIAFALMAWQAQSQTPEAQAKQELNEAARAYREGNFADAQAHSERALQLDPQNKAAPFFVARTIHAQYRPGISTPENVAKALDAIAAYQRILDRVPADEEAFKAVTYLYGALKDDERWREWVLRRAGNTSIPNNQRADAYVVLASRDWDCSFKITEANKTATADGNKTHFSYRMPKERAEFEQAKECANRGLEMANMAIILTPENESAWSYKTNILFDLSKLAEMAGEVQHQREFRRQYQEALEVTTKLSKRAQPNP